MESKEKELKNCRLKAQNRKIEQAEKWSVFEKSVLASQSRPTLCNLVDYIAHQVPLPMEFSGQEYWSGLPFPAPGDLPNPGIESVSPVAPALQVDSLPLSHQGSQTYVN